MNVIDTQQTATQITQEQEGLQDLVYRLINKYLSENKNVVNLHDLVLAEIEPPLLKAVLEKRRGNQLQAAKILGISRGTIRKKLFRYFGNKYFRLTDE